MKLTEQLKEEINHYFEHISAEELYRISVEKYARTAAISMVGGNGLKNKLNIKITYPLHLQFIKLLYL